MVCSETRTSSYELSTAHALSFVSKLIRFYCENGNNLFGCTYFMYFPLFAYFNIGNTQYEWLFSFFFCYLLVTRITHRHDCRHFRFVYVVSLCSKLIVLSFVMQQIQHTDEMGYVLWQQTLCCTMKSMHCTIPVVNDSYCVASTVFFRGKISLWFRENVYAFRTRKTISKVP